MSNHILFYWVMGESKPRSYSGILQSPLTFKPYLFCISLLSLLTGSAIEFRLFFRLKSNLNWNLLPSFANLPSLCDVRFTHRTQRDSASTVTSLSKWKFNERINSLFLGSNSFFPHPVVLHHIRTQILITPQIENQNRTESTIGVWIP